jgi:hypothetical protein
MVVSQAYQPNVTSLGILDALYASGNISTDSYFVGGGNAFSNLQSSQLVGNVANANVAMVVSQAYQPNVTSLGILDALYASGNISTDSYFVGGGNAFSNLQSSQLVGNVANANVAMVVSQAYQPNVTSLGILDALYASGNISTDSYFVGGGNAFSNLQSSQLVGNVANANVAMVVSQAYQPNITSVGLLSNLAVSNAVTTGNLVVTSNILPGDSSGNTYLTGNLVISGNVYTELGELGRGGGYYFSLGSDIALQTPYTGALYGTTYPLSVGLSNGFSISGTSTVITVTHNGNFQFNLPGPYLLRAVFNGSDNITGLAVGANAADIHGQDQGYLYRYTTFISQNPTELIEIPINVTDTSLYYYLDLFNVDGGTLKSTTTTNGGTYLTISPMQGGGVATGGPGGTPGTQWISSGSNIYFPNSIGIGPINPAYNLDVSTGTTATRLLITSNISSLGIYGPTLNINSNVIVSANLAVGGGGVPLISPPYALYVTGQGYFSNAVSYENFSGFRNRLVNGTFRVTNRANSITISNTSVFNDLHQTFSCDRWRIDTGNLSTSNVSLIVKQTEPIGTTNGFANCSNIFVTRALVDTTGNPWICPLTQTIEASFIFDFRWGQVTAKPCVFSFYANTSVAGDYSIVLRSRADNTYFANLVSITAGVWQEKYVYIPPCYIGSWSQDATAGYVDVLIGGVSYGTNGSANRAVAVTSDWTADPGFAPVSCIGATPWTSTTGALLQITGPQLESGTIATPFEVRPLTQTLIYCQRFYESNKEIQVSAVMPSGRCATIPYAVPKRTGGNVTCFRTLSDLTSNTNVNQFFGYVGGGAGPTVRSIDLGFTNTNYGFSWRFTQTGGNYNNATAEGQFVWECDSEIY